MVGKAGVQNVADVRDTPAPEQGMVRSPSWDAEQGVWVGSRALTTAESEEIPDPLVIFGYASLMFRPQESFAHVKSYGGWVKGWKRIWAQRSTDHRGTPDKPGLVCTVQSDAVLEKNGKRSPQDPPSWVFGVAYEIPQEIRDEVLDELDFREKGGYTRTVVEILKAPSPDQEGEVVRGLLYAGSEDNPNFYLPSNVEEAAQIIAWSHGPSGENKEYLFKVASFLTDAGATCPDSFTLVGEVDKVLAEGLDLRHRVDPRYTRLPPRRRLSLWAWGSNQHGQLGMGMMAAGRDAEEVWDPTSSYVDLDLWGPWPGVKQMATGGGHSALVLKNGRMYTWGWSADGQTGVYSEETEGDHAPFLRPFPRQVSMVALGHAHTLLIEKGTGKVFGLGADKFGEASGGGGGEGGERQPCREEGGVHVQRVTSPAAWVAAGVRHSAAVTEKGELVTWGCQKDGACLPIGFETWAPPDGAKVLKVCCGWRHTAILDDRQRVWTMGSNKHGQLGHLHASEAPLPQLVTDLPPCVDVACGWSHTVVRVAVPSSTAGETLVWGWGRNDLGQLGKPQKEGEAVVPVPRPLSPPSGVIPASLHCSSESTLLVGTDSSLWTTGWNEHGNLGVGDKTDRTTWTRVAVPRSIGRSSSATEWMVAAGGGHILALDLGGEEPPTVPSR